MISDAEVDAAYEVALAEAKCWRTVSFKGQANCYAIREPIISSLILPVSAPVPDKIAEERHLFSNDQFAGEYIQWRMIKAVLEHIENTNSCEPAAR